MKIAALVDDLLFTSRISEVAKQTGAEVVFCTSSSSVPQDADRICVDLNAAAFNPVQTIRSLASTHRAPITAFFSHVQTMLAKEATDAGAGEVIPRSMFVQRLPSLLGL